LALSLRRWASFRANRYFAEGRAMDVKPPKKPSKFPSSQIREASILATASSIGLSMVFAILLGAVGGFFLDRWLGTRPWFFIAGLLVGVVAGYRNVYILAMRLDAQAKEQSDRKDAPGANRLPFCPPKYSKPSVSAIFYFEPASPWPWLSPLGP
jgi:ATP synthase protein I